MLQRESMAVVTQGRGLTAFRTLRRYRRHVHQLPEPALVLLVGASGSGKSTWAATHYRPAEVVSSDALRGIVGRGPLDLGASADAFDLLDQIVAARLGRGLTVVIDTLGLDPDRRLAHLAAARGAGLAAVAVVLETDESVSRARNAARDRPVPARVLADQFKKARGVQAHLQEEGWDLVVTVTDDGAAEPRASEAAAVRPVAEGDVVLQLSRFPWDEDPARWLTQMATAAQQAGFGGIALMDHLIQIPQVDRAWSPIPEPFVTLGLLAGLDTDLRLGTLCTPATFRAAGILAKSFATLDALSGGRAFCGIGAGWFDREHAAYGLDFPPIGPRLDLVESAIETMRAIWAPGTKEYDGSRVQLPETTGYPRPAHRIPIIVGGRGERRTLRIAAALGDGCNLPSDLEALPHRIEVLHRHCDEVGRDRAEVAITVLDLPIVGSTREQAWERVEIHRGRASAADYARRHHAGTVEQHRRRHDELRALGVGTIFLSPMGLAGPEDVLALAALTR